MAAQTFTIDDAKRILVERVGMKESDVPDDPDATFESMDLDSLAFVEIQLAMQQEYGITIADEDADQDYMNRNTKEQMGVIKERLEQAAAEEKGA